MMSCILFKCPGCEECDFSWLENTKELERKKQNEEWEKKRRLLIDGFRELRKEGKYNKAWIDKKLKDLGAE